MNMIKRIIFYILLLGGIFACIMFFIYLKYQPPKSERFDSLRNEMLEQVCENIESNNYENALKIIEDLHQTLNKKFPEYIWNDYMLEYKIYIALDRYIDAAQAMYNCRENSEIGSSFTALSYAMEFYAVRRLKDNLKTLKLLSESVAYMKANKIDKGIIGGILVAELYYFLDENSELNSNPEVMKNLIWLENHFSDVPCAQAAKIMIEYKKQPDEQLIDEWNGMDIKKIKSNYNSLGIQYSLNPPWETE